MFPGGNIIRRNDLEGFRFRPETQCFPAETRKEVIGVAE